MNDLTPETCRTEVYSCGTVTGALSVVLKGIAASTHPPPLPGMFPAARPPSWIGVVFPPSLCEPFSTAGSLLYRSVRAHTHTQRKSVCEKPPSGIWLAWKLVRKVKMLRILRASLCLRSSFGKDALMRCHHTSLTNELIENMDKKATWDRFYTENDKGTFKNFEWFFGFHAIQDCIQPLLQTTSSTKAPLHVLDIGCGTSALGPCIYRHSECAVRVTCADISPVAVRLMQEDAENTPVQPCNPSSTLVFQEMDCTELEGHFRPGSLALIVDKGTTDALVRSKEGRAKAGQIVRQCLKVLRPSGHLLQFSDEDPDARLLWLEKESRGSEVESEVGVYEIGQIRGVTYFCYQITPCIAHH
uniref:Citrate synthase-lysine N-methyltransferase CSKMT, mitochondrial n=1 Tax=Astyanax mexicanus TaxID=7994 RepID=A0A3B1KKJ4_ASTMX